jgi:hypothetical protein
MDFFVRAIYKAWWTINHTMSEPKILVGTWQFCVIITANISELNSMNVSNFQPFP